MFVWPFSSEPLNLLWSNMVQWCIITSRSAIRKIGVLASRSFEGMSCEKLLCPMSKLLRRFKMLVNVCPENVFCAAEPFVTELDLSRYRHVLECHGKRLVCCLQGQVHSKGSYKQIMSLCYFFFWTTDSFANTLSLMVRHHKLECLVKRLDCCVQGQGHSKDSQF